ncbi:hypothetical protein ACFLXD_00815 [Chloroflexota bacterium]
MMSEEKEYLITVLSDLEVLADKCSRDIKNKQWVIAEQYREEYNRILDEVKKVQPALVSDMISISNKHYSHTISQIDDQFAKLLEVDNETSKLLSRLKP